MENKLTREFQKRSSIAEEWQRVKTEKRPFFKDVQIGEIGKRRLTLIHRPSFKPGVAWDIRESDDRYRVYRSDVCKYSESLIGYHLLQFDSKTLREYLSKLHAVKIELHPTGTTGCDGESTHLALYSRGAASIQLSWWGAPQNEWREIGAVVKGMIESLSKAELFDTFRDLGSVE